jgi:hypothetical protein
MLKAPNVQPWHRQLGQIVYKSTVEFMIRSTKKAYDELLQTLQMCRGYM